MNVIEKDVEELLKTLKAEHIIFEDQNILITGGAGFLGSWLCEVLLKQGANIICLDNFSSGLPENVKHLHSFRNFSLVKHDICEAISIDREINLVLHFASRASPLEFSRYPIQILDANTIGTRNALEVTKRHEARFVFSSTSEVYGNPDQKNIPTPESYWGHVNPNGARSCYDESKRVAEAYTMAYHNQYKLDTRIVRIHNTYGPKMRAGDVYGRVVSRFIDQAMKSKPITIFGSGRQTRSFTYVTDMLKGILKISHSSDLSGDVINIGSSIETEIIQLARMIKKLTYSDSIFEFLPLPPDDPNRRCPDTSKIKKILKWEPRIDLVSGLEKTIDWFKSI